MKLGIVVNVMDSDEAGATTYRLAADAINAGHEVWVMSTGSLACNPTTRSAPWRAPCRRAGTNVFTPGGLGSAQKFEKVSFTHAVLAALQRRVDYMKFYRRNFSNLELATL